MELKRCDANPLLVLLLRIVGANINELAPDFILLHIQELISKCLSEVSDSINIYDTSWHSPNG